MTKKIHLEIAIALVLVVLILFLSGCDKQSSDTSMFRANIERTGVYPVGGPTTLNQLMWKFKTDDAVVSSPALSGNVVYFGSMDGYLYAVDIQTGQERWKFETDGIFPGVFSSPAISGGVVYFGSDEGFHAVDVQTVSIYARQCTSQLRLRCTTF